MMETRITKIIPEQVDFEPEYAALVFQEKGYVEMKVKETSQEKTGAPDSGLYLRITPLGLKHLAVMKPFIVPRYMDALKILGLIPPAA